MTSTITGLFDTYGDATSAVKSLKAAGVPSSDISIMAKNGHDHDDDAASDAGIGAGVGSALGGAGGLLAGLGIMAIPGVGPVVAAGWLAATAAGAAAGAVVGGAAGGIVGALTNEGVPEKDAHVYAEGVRRGGAIVTARVDESLVSRTRTILAQSGEVDVMDRRRDYETKGWTGFGSDAPFDPRARM